MSICLDMMWYSDVSFMHLCIKTSNIHTLICIHLYTRNNICTHVCILSPESSTDGLADDFCSIHIGINMYMHTYIYTKSSSNTNSLSRFPDDLYLIHTDIPVYICLYVHVLCRARRNRYMYVRMYVSEGIHVYTCAVQHQKTSTVWSSREL